MTPQLISSRKNEMVKHAAKLAASSEYRNEHNCFLAEGARLCRDAAYSNLKVESLFFTKQAQEKYSTYICDISEKAEQIFEIEPHVAEAMSSTKNSQGVFCICKMPDSAAKIEAIQLCGHFIALENIQNPANFGAVLRTAEALGLKGAILVGTCCDLYSPKVLRASMGAVFRLPFYFAESMELAAEQLHKVGFYTYAAVPSAQAMPITKIDFSHPCVMAVGNEGNGLTQSAISSCTKSVTIPMLGRAESLNAASSAAILMWEMMRQSNR